MTDPLPTETPRQLAMRVRAGIVDPRHASSTFLADVNTEALAALDLLLNRLDTFTEALKMIAHELPTEERNPDGDEQAAYSMQTIARDALQP